MIHSLPNIAIQGKITDESLIKSITVGDVTASYNPSEMNPGFYSYSGYFKSE